MAGADAGCHTTEAGQSTALRNQGFLHPSQQRKTTIKCHHEEQLQRGGFFPVKAPFQVQCPRDVDPLTLVSAPGGIWEL